MYQRGDSFVTCACTGGRSPSTTRRRPPPPRLLRPWEAVRFLWCLSDSLRSLRTGPAIFVARFTSDPRTSPSPRAVYNKGGTIASRYILHGSVRRDAERETLSYSAGSRTISRRLARRLFPVPVSARHFCFPLHLRFAFHSGTYTLQWRRHDDRAPPDAMLVSLFPDHCCIERDPNVCVSSDLSPTARAAPSQPQCGSFPALSLRRLGERAQFQSVHAAGRTDRTLPTADSFIRDGRKLGKRKFLRLTARPPDVSSRNKTLPVNDAKPTRPHGRPRQTPRTSRRGLV